MKIEHRMIDDLKTERPDVTPALPAYFKAVPLFFYLVVIGGILLSVMYFISLQKATADAAHWTSEGAKLKQELGVVQGDRDAVEGQTRRANAIVAWVEGARNVQPLVVAMIRTVDEGSSIAELGLVRDQETPTHLKLKLRLNTQGVRQLDAIIEKIGSYNFKTYNPNQTQSKGEVDYAATLIYQSNAPTVVVPNPGKQQ